ncbi:DUF4202 domain-containing protein [Thioclava sp. FR2]|uniref:DUF4202 domain-containing protein n=1 Tax=Thioclava sp. FR2 TaxID=3445780 RepID=UPI003EB86D78
MNRLQNAFEKIDAANRADPNIENGLPAAFLYGQRMTIELSRLVPSASEVLQIAARGQHIERWLLPRTDYPAGKEGYFAWRREQGRRHAVRVAEIMASVGYPTADQERVGVLLRKEGIKRDSEVQTLEDVVCFVFIRWYFAPFAEGRGLDENLDIVRKTARKMSDQARLRAIKEFDLPEHLADAIRPKQGD